MQACKWRVMVVGAGSCLRHLPAGPGMWSGSMLVRSFRLMSFWLASACRCSLGAGIVVTPLSRQTTQPATSSPRRTCPRSRRWCRL